MSEKDPLIFIEHILENIEIIENASKNISKKDIDSNKEKQYAIVRAIEVIGEAVKNLPQDFIKRYPKIPWKEIVGTRDKLIHHYFGVDLEEIWKIVQEDIPALKKDMLKIKEDLNN